MVIIIFIWIHIGCFGWWLVLSVDVYHNAWYGVTALDTKCDQTHIKDIDRGNHGSLLKIARTQDTNECRKRLSH